MSEVGDRDIEFHSSTFAFFSTLRDMFGRKQSFVAIDISGETTDLTISDNGRLAEHISFPCGKNQILRYLARSNNSVRDEAESLARLYLDNRLNGVARNRFEQSLEKTRQIWLKNLKDSLESFTELSILPETIYLIGEDALVGIFGSWLRATELNNIVFAGVGFDVKVVNKDMLSIFSSCCAGTSHDNFMMLETVFCAKLYNKA